MVRKFLAVLALASAMLFLGSAVWADQSCLRGDQIFGWKALPDNRALVVTDRSHQRFKVTLNGMCNDLNWRLRLRFSSFTGSRLSCLTRGDMIIARPEMGMLGDRCPIANVEPYTTEMEKADAIAAEAAKHTSHD